VRLAVIGIDFKYLPATGGAFLQQMESLGIGAVIGPEMEQASQAWARA